MDAGERPGDAPSPDMARKMNAYWRAANDLSVGQIYLYDNPLPREPLKLSHVKPLVTELAELAPKGDRRMGANPHANGRMPLRDLRMPDFRAYAANAPSPGAVAGQDTLVLGYFLRDIAKLNQDRRNFRVFGPDETQSNLLGAVFEVTERQWDARTEAPDEALAPSGRVLDSMLSQNATWLKATSELPLRRKIASFNYVLASHVRQQDHNGFTHQDPGLLDHVVNKKANIVRVYLPPDANFLLSVMDHCLRSRRCVNVVVAGKRALPQWPTMDEAAAHCTEGIGIWPWASNDQGAEPDLVMASCGDTPTLEILAAVFILREHPRGLSENDYDSLFTKDKHIIFGFHGYPWLVHRLTYRRADRSLHVRGYVEESTITTAFDIRAQNKLDRFHLVQDAVDRLPRLGAKGAYLRQSMADKLIEHKQYMDAHGEDLPEVRNWKWKPR